jgi:hypothetical protein
MTPKQARSFAANASAKNSSPCTFFGVIERSPRSEASREFCEEEPGIGC